MTPNREAKQQASRRRLHEGFAGLKRREQIQRLPLLMQPLNAIVMLLVMTLLTEQPRLLDPINVLVMIAAGLILGTALARYSIGLVWERTVTVFVLATTVFSLYLSIIPS